ncbi:MAG: DUF11 domain-containing protein [Anaerolineae bacterium]|nr:DUF11 domain-containing protein [Anaerolineae bacterium]
MALKQRYVATIGMTLAFAGLLLLGMLVLISPDASAMKPAQDRMAQQGAPENSTPQPLPFSQDWTNTNLVTADDDWSGVPGVMGYRGDGLTGATGTDPQTLLMDGTDTPVDVNANRTDPDTFITGGVSEFEIADPVVALQGSGTADAPFLLVTVDTSGYSNIVVSYNLRDIDGSADDAIQQVALHYRIGDSGDFTNLPDGYVPDATTGPSLAVLVTPINVTLPADADNQSVVQIRVMTTNAVGSDEWVGVDDISITGTSGDLAPAVASTDPEDGATGVAIDANILITFTEPVAVAGTWFNINCSISGDHAATVSGGDTTFTLDPAIDFSNDDVCTTTIYASQVTDLDTDDPPDNMAADYIWTFTVASLTADVTFVYHDLEDVIWAGDQLYLAGDFNGWSTIATPMTGDVGGEVFTATVTSLVIGNSYEYKYVVKSGGDQWDWLQTANRSFAVTGPETLNDYRDVAVGWAVLQWPPTLQAKAFQPTDPVYGRLYIQNVTNPVGEGRGIKAEVGYGNSVTPSDWTWFPMVFNVDDFNNDEFTGVITPTAGGIYSYTVRFDGNWGSGNPNAEWTYGDLDGYAPGVDPFELDQTGVMTVIIYDVEVLKTAAPAEIIVEDGLGALVTHTITINNLSTLTDTVGVTITDLLPPGFVYVSDTAPVPPINTNPPIWILTDPIAAGESLGFQVVVSATDAITRSGSYTNVVTIEVSPPDWLESNNEAEATVMVYRLLSIAEARLRPIDELVLVEGTVTVEPGVFKESTNPNRKLYMEDDTGGVLVYRAEQLDPVDRSHKVRVLGTMDEYRTETELVPALAADVIDLGPTSPVVPLAIDTGAVDESVEGQLVQIAGTIIDKPSSYQLQVDDGSGMVWVYRYYNLGQPGDPNYIDFSTLLVGDYVLVTGVTRGYDYSGTVRREILPRGPADVSKPVADLTTSTKASEPADQQVRAGDLVTYTITLINVGTLDVTATAVDSLPGYYTVYDAGDFVEAPAGTLTWTGLVPGGGQVELQFVARVIDGLAGLPVGVTPLANSVLIDDGIHTAFYVLDPLPPWVIKYGVYLPLVSRNQ